MAIIIDGKLISKSIKEQLKKDIDGIYKRYDKVPTMGIIWVGDNESSATYIRNKIRACEECRHKNHIKAITFHYIRARTFDHHKRL